MELKTLNSNRGYVKGCISRIFSFCRSEVLKNASSEILVEKRNRLREAFQDYQSFNKAILVLDPEDIEKYDEYEDKYYTSVGILESAIKTTNTPNPEARSSSGEFRNLPKIVIPGYDGKNVVDYYPFINMFKSVIHNDAKLSSCEKLYYLRSYLSGDALDLIKNLTLNDDNYISALKLLENRYDNIPKIINYHINALLDMPAFSKCTASNLRSLISSINLHLTALKNLKQPVEQWDSLLINIFAKKVDSYTYRGFHLERNAKNIPSLAEFIEFLEKRALALENTVEEKQPDSQLDCKSARASRQVSSLATKKPPSCKYCNQTHKLYECQKFKMLPESERMSFVRDKDLCTVCLNEHKGECMLRIKCGVCQQKHNTLLHVQLLSIQDSRHESPADDNALNNDNVVSMSSTSGTKDVLLPTAIVRLYNENGNFIHARALLDSGSQVSFITDSLIKSIHCDIVPTNQLVTGVVEGTNKIEKKANVTIHSLVNDYKLNVSCCIVKNITCQLPQQSIDISQFNIPSHIKLADKKFYETGEISLLLGCDVFFQVLQRESFPLLPSGPFLINTSFGYIAAGSLPVSTGKVFSSNLCVNFQGRASLSSSCNAQELSQNKRPKCDLQLDEINSTISKFWECEKVPTVFKEGTTEQELSEKCFQNSVKLIDKRFSVALPLKLNLQDVQLGDSFSYALQRLYNLEKRLEKDSSLSQQYKKFIHDYLDQGHAHYVDISNYDLNSGQVYFLPHHPVFNSNSKTTPVRAVFDASMKTKTGLCLNDILLNGDVHQSDLFDILVLFRTYKYILLCDIKAMYRQFFVDEQYRCLQNILWRDSKNEAVKCIQLKTVTYGLKSSSFLATRCLIELANRFQKKFPLASFVLRHSSYMDDILCGSNDITELGQTKKELNLIMSEASLSLHKWSSNYIDILKDIPSDLQQLSVDKDFDKNNSYLKTLGLSYDVNSDTLNMRVPETEVLPKYTKRQALSFISKTFDPLGLIGPILTCAKYLMQQVWCSDLNWDDYLPELLNKQFVDFATNLVRMSCISIPRNVNVPSSKCVELVGYADASNIAYGCCLYLRVVDANHNVKVNLLCSKSRINPKNKQLTTPRLELNSALLLVMLAKKVNNTLSVKYNVKTFLYSDSQIVLSWLGMEPEKLSVYVANRVKQIRLLSSNYEWFYVRTADNPADCLSRGVTPESLKADVGKLWFHGPKYLEKINYTHCNAESKSSINNIPELKPVSRSCNICNTENLLRNVFEKYSCIEKITRIMCYVKRFIHNCKRVNINKRKMSNVCPEELTMALHSVIKLDQESYFRNEIERVKVNETVNSNLANLNPFLDADGLLRVGGRLQNADIPFSQRHPIILPKKSVLTKLIILHEHLRLKHAGQKSILCSLNERYWLINANREIKAVIHKCLICFKLKAKAATQLMGSLPLDRVNMSRGFQIVGTDYAGPFYVKQTRIRKPVITKAYVVIFVCFITKAVHIELASDMTTNTFLSCLKRFISRRNKPTKIYCDNGAYYRGANNVLKELYEMQSSAEHQSAVINYSNLERISFHFIPSYSPVFGGLWEAGIKSIKHHLKRVIATTVLTYEEMYTVLVQIEGILNSRPLTPMSRDPNDMTYLSPAHFLTGSPITSYPELNLIGTNVGRLSFWKKCTQMQQQFWKQWHKQYLVMLQSRPKWKNVEPNLTVGEMVILKDENVTPLKWPIGRIVNVLPGKDSRVRALDVKTVKGSIIRTSIMKVCPFPIDYN